MPLFRRPPSTPRGETTGSPRARRHRLRRGRRVLAVACAVPAIALTVQTLAPAAPETVPVVVAAADLPAGHALTEEDLETLQLPASAARWESTPPSELEGHTLATPVAAGDPVTARLALDPPAGLTGSRELAFVPVLEEPVRQAATAGRHVRITSRATGKVVVQRAVVRASITPDPESVDAAGGLWVELTAREVAALASATGQGGSAGLDGPLALTLLPSG